MKQKNPKPLKPKADKFCKVHSRTVFECEMQFFQLATLISQEKNKQPKWSLHLQQTLPGKRRNWLGFPKLLKRLPPPDCPTTLDLTILGLKETVTFFRHS